MMKNINFLVDHMNSESQDIDGSQASTSMACAEWPEGETDGHLLRPDIPTALHQIWPEN